jgi:hypothetical protein
MELMAPLRRLRWALPLVALACSKPVTEGEPLAWSEAAVGNDAQTARATLDPPICAKKGNAKGKVYALEGYPHWGTSSLCYNEDCSVYLYTENKPDGTPVERQDLPQGFPSEKYPGYVKLTVHLNKFVDEPKLLGATDKVEGVTSNKSRTTSGTLVRDSLALHLSDGTKVNNLVRVRAFIRVIDFNGVCQLTYVGGVRAPAETTTPTPLASASSVAPAAPVVTSKKK